MDKLIAIKIKKSNGSYEGPIPIGTQASYVDWDSDNTLVNILGASINIDPETGAFVSIQDQINAIDTKKADKTYVDDQIDTVEQAISTKVSQSAMESYVSGQVSPVAAAVATKITQAQMESYVDPLIDNVEFTIKSLAAQDIEYTPPSILQSTNVQNALNEVAQMANKTIDSAMSSSSTNAVQNKVIKAYVDSHEVATDSAMSDSSTNPVQNKIIKAYVDTKVGDVDSAMSDSSTKPVQNKVIKAYVDAHGVATDSAMSDSSVNPVQNKTIKAYVDTPTFTQASTRNNINSGENRSTLFGKIKKYFSDLKSVAFSGNYSDLTNKPTSKTAAQGGTEDSLVTTGEKYIWNNKTGVTELTEAEYNVLPESEKLADKLFLITDSTEGQLAEEVRYDNTDSGLTAVNVQDAIDEIEEDRKSDTIFLSNVPVSAITGDIAVVNDSRITPKHVVTNVVWGNSSAITTDVTWSVQTPGQLVLNGTCTSATTVDITLSKTGGVIPVAESKISHDSWQFVGSASTVRLPSKYSEIYVRVTPSASGGNWFRSIIIPRIALTSSLVQYSTGDYAGQYGSCKVNINASITEVQLAAVYDAGSNVTSNSAMYVYVK